MFLMMKRAFDELGYRRYEWKCDDLNAASKRTTARYGFSFEGIFRQATVTKGRNRDTAWFSIIDKERPAIMTAFGAWLTVIDVQRVEDLLNNRPRKALNYHSTNEVFAKLTDPPENYALGM
jgi:hypothetical protein